ncbi:MAG: DUF448 domain-containing protein [Pseudomonadota bacterium]
MQNNADTNPQYCDEQAIIGLPQDFCQRLLGDSPMRACLTNRTPVAKWQAIRFVCDPNGDLCPDIFAKLPGHGAWVSARRKAIKNALARNLFAKSLKTAPPDDGLLDRLEDMLARATLNGLSLAKRAGGICMGFHEVESYLTGNNAALVIIADGSGDQARKLQNILAAKQRANQLSGWMQIFSPQQLGAALGKAQANYVCIKTKPFMRSVLQHAGRYHMIVAGAKS